MSHASASSYLDTDSRSMVKETAFPARGPHAGPQSQVGPGGRSYNCNQPAGVRAAVKLNRTQIKNVTGPWQVGGEAAARAKEKRTARVVV